MKFKEWGYFWFYFNSLLYLTNRLWFDYDKSEKKLKKKKQKKKETQTVISSLTHLTDLELLTKNYYILFLKWMNKKNYGE